MKSYVITGKLLTNGKKGSVTTDALDKQEIWSNPSDFGFSKVFKVEEHKGIQKFNKREIAYE